MVSRKPFPQGPLPSGIKGTGSPISSMVDPFFTNFSYVLNRQIARVDDLPAGHGYGLSIGPNEEAYPRVKGTMARSGMALDRLAGLRAQLSAEAFCPYR